MRKQPDGSLYPYLKGESAPQTQGEVAATSQEGDPVKRAQIISMFLCMDSNFSPKECILIR